MARESFAIGSVRVRAGASKSVELPLIRMVTGGEISIPVQVVHGREPGPTIWINAAIHGDERHWRERNAAASRCERLSESDVPESVPVAPAESMQIHGQRQPAARSMLGWIGDREADRSMAGVREETPGARRPRRTERETRLGDRACAVEVVEQPFPRQDTVLDQLDSGKRGAEHLRRADGTALP